MGKFIQRKEGFIVADKKDELIVQLKKKLRVCEERCKELEKLVIKDPLTGALNRRGIEKAFRRMRELAQRHTLLPLCAMVVDIDHFKLVNDAHSHLMGDEVIKEVVRRLQRGVRASDAVARFGGEEFVVLLQGGNITRATERLHRLLCGTPYRTKAGELTVTVSAGVAELIPGECFNALFRRADAALYQAKANGRNRVVVTKKG